MRYEDKTREQLIQELSELRRRVADLERVAVQRRRTEEKLRESQLRYYSLFEQSPDGIILIDAETARIIDFNTAAHQQLGYTREEFAKLSIYDLEAYETPEEIKESIRNALNRGKAEFLVHHKTKSGEIRNIQVTAQAMMLEGHIVFHSIYRDITEQKRAEEQLRESEEKYRDLFENAIDPIFIVDADLNYINVNRRAVEMFGFSKEEFLAMSILDVIPPEQVPRSNAEFEKLRQRGAYEKFVGKMRKKDGTYADIEVSSSAIYDDGKITGSRDIVRNITDRRQIEEEQQKLIKELQEALATVKTLSGMLPICAACKKVRDDKGYWNQIEQYIKEHSGAEFSHGLCPECAKKLYPDFYAEKE